MEREQQAVDRVIRWRFEGYWSRLGQGAFMVLLAWPATNSILVPIWFAASLAVFSLDATLFRRLHADMQNRRLRGQALTVMALSTTLFASMGPILVAHRSPISLAAGMLFLCASNLNNAVMTRGWTLATRISVGGSAVIMLLTTPLAALWAGYGMGVVYAGALELGVLGYIVFIAMLVAILNRERADLHRAQEHWTMLFAQSPLPQICFDASRIYDLLRGYTDADAPRLGDVLRSKVSSVAEALSMIRLTGTNRATEELYGVARFEGSMDVQYFDASFLAGFCDSLNGLAPDGSFPPFDAKVLREDGSSVDVCVHIRTVPTSDHAWGTCIATFVDMTDVRRAAKAQQEAVDAAETANRAKSEFLATMSHEIRTPLNGVLGMVQAMAREELPALQRERLELIGESGETLLTILNDILDLSKIEAGKLELEAADFDLAALALGAQRTFAHIADSKGLGFNLEVDEAARGTYRGDSTRVRQVLYNLISNAVKFTASGSVGVHIGRSDTAVRFIVTDTGIGMSAEQIERLFDKFVQADSSTTRRFGGTGLGLSICRELCRAMGGEITAASELGGGSRFTVDLPLLRTGDTGRERPQDVAAATPALVGGVLRVLAAEDNRVNQLVLKTLLSQAGLDLTLVSNGEEAVAAWEEAEWDVILMDMQMPVMDGTTAARHIRRREAETGRSATPIIALTANAMDHQVAAYRAAGMNAFVAKPIDVGALFEAIAGAVHVSAEATSAVA
jgi:CheY-like chemotaxis protein